MELPMSRVLTYVPLTKVLIKNYKYKELGYKIFMHFKNFFIIQSYVK